MLVKRVTTKKNKRKVVPTFLRQNQTPTTSQLVKFRFKSQSENMFLKWDRSSYQTLVKINCLRIVEFPKYFEFTAQMIKTLPSNLQSKIWLTLDPWQSKLQSKWTNFLFQKNESKFQTNKINKLFVSKNESKFQTNKSSHLHLRLTFSNFVTRFNTSLQTEKTFYTDANCFELKQRVFSFNRSDTISGNFYPGHSTPFFSLSCSKNLNFKPTF